MSNLASKIIEPHSILIEETALKFAATYYEVGRSQGLVSKFKNARAFARANVERFIPLAVQTLMDMLSNPATPESQKQMIYDAFIERTNDKELSNSGIGAFKNDTPFLPELPKLYDKPTLDNIFDAQMEKERKQPKKQPVIKLIN
jgi:hypothetical protein